MQSMKKEMKIEEWPSRVVGCSQIIERFALDRGAL
jgi:hypothetical protein